MLRYVYANDLAAFPELATSMFKDRADQFKTRLGWEVEVDGEGAERDSYDAMNPLYVIWEEPDGSHGGSMRFLPTTGPVMVNDHFGHLISGPVTSPLIWECTRFCLARGAGAHVAAALMLGGGEIMQGFGVEHFVGVFDARMVRIYRMIGSSPEVLGSFGGLTGAHRRKLLRAPGSHRSNHGSGSISRLARCFVLCGPKALNRAGPSGGADVGWRHDRTRAYLL